MRSTALVVALVLIYNVQVALTDNVGKPGSEKGCSPNAKTERLQVAFVCDQTATNIENLKVLARKAQGIMDALNQIHPHTEFALTTHANWDKDALSEPRIKREAVLTGRHDDMEGCYDVAQSFTTVTEEVSDAALAVKLKGSTGIGRVNFDENAISALAMTAADKNIGWIPGDVDSAGRNVHKFLVLFTDVFSIFKLPNPEWRHEFRGDGTDTCITSRPASRQKAAEVLRRHGVIIIGAYVPNPNTGRRKFVQDYKEYFRTHGAGIPYEARLFEDQDDLDRGLVAMIKKNVKKNVERVCYCRDPPGYNTLGL